MSTKPHQQSMHDMKLMNKTGLFSIGTVGKESQKVRLPALDLYYKRSVFSSTQSQTLLHFPIKPEVLAEQAVAPPRSEQATKPAGRAGPPQSKNLRFTSFQEIGERNHVIVDIPVDDLDEANAMYMDQTKPMPNHQNPKKFNKTENSSTNMTQEVDLELKHNRFMYNYLQKHQNDDIVQQLNQLRDRIQQNEKTQRAIELVRSYPTQKKLGSVHQFSSVTPEVKVPVSKSRRQSGHKATRQVNGNQHFFGTPLVFWLSMEEDSRYKADFREMASSATLGQKAFVYGGIGMHVLNDLVEIDLGSGKVKKLVQNGDQPLNRYAGALHALTYQIPISYAYSASKVQHGTPSGRQLVMFAGETSFNAQLKQRECLCDMRIYNIDSGEWKYLRPNSDFMPESRRSFGSCIVGKGLLIHGGLTNRSNYLNDTYYLNLSLCKWSVLELSANPFPTGIAFHQLVPVYSRLQNVGIGELKIEKSQGNLVRKFKQEGIYSFGGCYQDSKKNLKFDIPFLQVFCMHQSPMHWVVPETIGQSPPPRTLHSTTYVQSYNSIVIVGGRNDTLQIPYMNDMHLLQLDTLTWVAVNQVGAVPLSRAGHCAFQYKSQLLVMGGINLEGYLSSSLDKCEMDRMVARQLFEQSKLKGSMLPPSQAPGVESQEASAAISPSQPSKAKLSLLRKQTLVYEDPDIKASAEQAKKKELKCKIELLKYENFNPLVPEDPSNMRYYSVKQQHQHHVVVNRGQITNFEI